MSPLSFAQKNFAARKRGSPAQSSAFPCHAWAEAFAQSPKLIAQLAQIRHKTRLAPAALTGSVAPNNRGFETGDRPMLYWSSKRASEGEMAMATQEREYTVDDVWRLELAKSNPLEKYYLIDGELCIKMAPSELHGDIATRIAAYLFLYVEEEHLGRVGVEVGFHPPDNRKCVLLPDVSFISEARMSRRARSTYVPYMPDLAVEIISPSQSLAQVRRKAETYLRHGTELVWLIDPEARTAEVWRQGTEQRDSIDAEGALSGGAILPGFSLPLKRLFPD